MDQFISEPLQPVLGTFDTVGMAIGEPGLPGKFTWRKTEHTVTEVLEKWISSTPERAGGEMYLRRHWWKLKTDTGHTLTIYCTRQAKSTKKARERWFVFSMEAGGS